MRILFFGTPEFARPSFEALLSSEHEIAAVVTQPDRKRGRSQKILPPIIKERALEEGLPCFQPDSLKDPEFLSTLKDFDAACAVVVAFGRILPPELRVLFPHGAINLHPSLLPKYRGAAPVPWTLMGGETETGVTIFQMDDQLDHGPILVQHKISIEPEDNTPSLNEKLSALGNQALLEALEALEQGNATLTPQDDAQACTAPKLSKEDGVIDWEKDAVTILNHIRGLQPWPSAMTFWDEKRIKIFEATLVEGQAHGAPGTVLTASEQEGLRIQTGQGQLAIKQLQLESTKVLDIADFLRGHSIPVGAQLSHA